MLPAAFPTLAAYASQGEDGATRSVTHAMGTIDVPANPQRVVTFEATVTDMLDLGIPPVGARNLSRERRCHPDLASEFDKIFELGGQELDLEDVINLEPDLILGTSPSDDEIYETLLRIAPTVLYERGDDVDHKAQWEAFLLYHAGVLGKEAEAQELLANWEARIAHFKARVAERGLGDTVVSIISINRNNDLRFQTKGGHSGGVLRKAGLRRPPSQDLDAQQTDAISNGEDTERYSVSFERLLEGDGDVIFLWGSPSSAPIEDNSQVEVTQKNLAALKADPIWGQLGAVRNGRLYEVGGYWDSRSYLAANMILDDLYRGVLQEEPV